MKERACGETNPLSYCCCILSNILEETSDDNRGTTRHLPPRNAGLRHQQTFDLPSCMHQTEIGNYGWLQGGLLGEARDNGKEATKCCCSNHCNIDEQSLHQGIPVYTSAVNK